MSGSEIQYPSQNRSPENNEAVSLESSQSNHFTDDGNDYHWTDNDNAHDHHFTEEYYPDDEDDSTSDYEEEYSSDTPSPSKRRGFSDSPSPSKRRRFTKFIDQVSKRERRKEHSSPSSRPAFRRKRKTREHSVSESDGGSDGRRRRRSKEGRYGRRVKKVERVERIRQRTVKSKSYKKRNISERERHKVVEAADKFRSEFPSFRAVLRPHNLYNSFVYVPARFALKFLNGESEMIRLENMKGKQWDARCFYRYGSGNGMMIGGGWSRFAMDNELKEGDVCVFELVNRKHIMLRVRIFRVRDYADR